MSKSPVSRRELFSRLFGRKQPTIEAAKPKPKAAPQPRTTTPQPAEVSWVAALQERFCLAYQRSFCSVCVERCPVPGAIVVEEHLPRIHADICTGCGVCNEVCPAPQNAILILPRTKSSSRK